MSLLSMSNIEKNVGVPVKCDRVVKIYKKGSIEVMALRELTMEVEAGEIRAVVGPSGSGKTTLLNLIGGIDYPTAGNVYVGNTNVSKLSLKKLVHFRRTQVGFIFQFFNLIPTLTALENVELPMLIANTFKGERRKRAASLLELVGLSGRENHKPGELSGGEQQRVAIAAALANDPPLILADEPTGELDTKTARQVIDLFKQINEETSKTFIIVTHDIKVAMAADHISRIEDGRIISTITPDEMHGVEAVAVETRKREDIVRHLQIKLEKLEQSIKELEQNFKAGKIDAETFTRRYNELKKAKELTEEELKRYTLV